MTPPRPPRIEQRRAPQFAAELRERARAWLPSWGLADGERDFGRALLDVAARFSSEVAERLDRAGEKMQRGLLDFLAVRARAARPARMPVVFQLADTAVDPVLASAPVQMQVDAGGTAVVFETETDVRLLPGRLALVAAVDADADAVYLPPPGLHDLEPLEPAPTLWQLKSPGSSGAKTLQLDPEAGLVAGMIVETAGQQYRIVEVNKEIVTIEPPLTGELPALTILRKVTSFAPFDGAARDRQEHALYLGQTELLDIETAATIGVVGAQTLREGVSWQYWGTAGESDVVDWQRLTLAPDEQQQVDAVVLAKPPGKIEPREIGAGNESRWIRAYTTNIPAGQPPFQADELAIRINAGRCDDPDGFPVGLPSPAAEGMANTMPLVLDREFFPLGREPRLFDAFYLACPEAFSKPGAEVQLQFGMGDASLESLAYLRSGPLAHRFFAGVSSDGHLNLLHLDEKTGLLSRDAAGPLRPPSPGPGGVVVDEAPIPLDPRPNHRAAMWMDGTDVLIAVAAAGTVWVWRQAGSASTASGWEDFGPVPVTDPTQPIAGIVYVGEEADDEMLLVLREGKLFYRDLNDPALPWRQPKGASVELETIAPILVQESTGSSTGTLGNGMVGTGRDEKLYHIEFEIVSPNDLQATYTVLLTDVAAGIAPAAASHQRGGGLEVAVAVGKEQTDRLLWAWIGDAPDKNRPFPGIGTIGRSLDVNHVNGAFMFALSVQSTAERTAVALWQPELSVSDFVLREIPEAAGPAAGSASLLPRFILVPATLSRVLLAVGTTGTVWKVQLDGANPILSWEYANGTGWWKLDPLDDGTLNLKRSGNVTFTVPDDLRPMDWAGRTRHWIRARLAGGDYGKEVVTVTTTASGSPAEGRTTQRIERSTTGVRPPSVASLRIAYRLCTSLRPTFVLAQDSGSIRDQSEANRIRGAAVEAFVPLAVTVGRFFGPAASPASAEPCPQPCACSSAHEATADAPAAASLTVASRPATGRALFIGLDATPSGVPVNVLLLVEKEAPHESFAPMRIEALVADRLVPIAADDTTRALGESGLLSMAFAVAPTPRELFGVENLTWLRLTPGGNAPVTGWKPHLRGAYLNAVFASAAETLTRELLGSSAGEPDLTLSLARPPVLRDTLELRVREPLGDEEREALRQEDESRVLSAVEGLPGHWVLWRQVSDPGDECPAARVYALDEATGEIRFGDGQHGAIPPIGTDSIVAFRYRRTEPGAVAGAGVPANSVTPRTALGLVSPVETVETVLAADHAAGGAPPESAERVVRFGTARLRHRNRAVTARDFEDLALESSPDIVQARCFTGRGGVRLIVVMRGADPLPNAAEVRELRRLLLLSSPASLGAPGAFRITGPRIRRLRIVLGLRVATLDHAGEVARGVQRQIEALFDTARWALGAEPKDEDIALAVIDTPHLEGLAAVELREVVADDEERPWTDAVKRDELAMLDKDPLRLEFETVEVIS